MAGAPPPPPAPPWLRHPEIPRYSIGWRMGHGESYLNRWWEFAQTTPPAALVDYFRAYAPVPTEWVDFVAMALAPPQRDPITAAEVQDLEFEDAIARDVERIAHLGLFDVEAWRRYLAGP